MSSQYGMQGGGRGGDLHVVALADVVDVRRDRGVRPCKVVLLPSGGFACLSGLAQFLIPGLHEVIQYIIILQHRAGRAR